MIHPANADIVSLLHHTVKALQPYALSHKIQLRFKAALSQQNMVHDPKKIMDVLTGLICQLVNFLPEKSCIHVSTKCGESGLILLVANTGMDLSRVHEITSGLHAPISVTGTGNGTLYQYQLPVIASVEEQENKRTEKPVTSYWRSHYALIRKRLRSHFSKADNLVDLLNQQHPADVAFLKQINTLIFSNIENESFDTAALCREMSMSRTQLFRKLKPLIRQAPAQYIRVMRLQKAKELLETSHLSVGEITFRTGFQSASHFSKAFIQYFGMPPSSVRRTRDATK